MADKDKEPKKPKSTPEEDKFIAQIDAWQEYAENNTKRKEFIDNCEDERKAFIGDQWNLSIAPRSQEGRTRRPNSVNNFILPTVMNITDGLTTSLPDISFSGRERNDDQTAEKLNDVVPYIFDQNDVEVEWTDTILQGIQHGPFIMYVPWNPYLTGGSGPNRWVGDVQVLCQKYNEIFFDPAILDLRKRLQECTFINRKFRKKLDWIKDRWPETGKYVVEDTDYTQDTETQDEGMDPQQATVIENWHKGTPKFVSRYWKDRFLQKAGEYEAKNLPYKAQEYRDMAAGKYKGVHCCYKAGNVLLDYTPYVYDDGLYPFCYEVLYLDEKNPLGFGESRNLLMPQVLYNKADEIEIESMTREGLGGMYYNKGSVSRKQLDDIIDKGAQAGMWFEVNDKSGLEKREPTQTPQSLLLFKENKKKQIDTTSQNTAIAQGVSPGANVPFASIQELGGRSDVRRIGKEKILIRLMKKVCRMVISRIAQFYDTEREYLIRGNKSTAIKTLVFDAIKQITEMQDPNQQAQAIMQLVNTIKTMNADSTARYGTFQNSEMMRTWERDGQTEEYIPVFDIEIMIQDVRPNSRRYYENLALQLFGRGIGIKAFWETIQNGRFPPIDEILQELQQMQEQQQASAMMADQAKIQAKQTKEPMNGRVS